MIGFYQTTLGWNESSLLRLTSTRKLCHKDLDILLRVLCIGSILLVGRVLAETFDIVQALHPHDSFSTTLTCSTSRRGGNFWLHAPQTIGCGAPNSCHVLVEELILLGITAICK